MMFLLYKVVHCTCRTHIKYIEYIHTFCRLLIGISLETKAYQKSFHLMHTYHQYWLTLIMAVWIKKPRELHVKGMEILVIPFRG